MKFFAALLLSFGFFSGLAAETLAAHPCSQQPLPLSSEAELLQAVQCHYPDARILRMQAQSDGQHYLVRLLVDGQVMDLRYHLPSGELAVANQ